MGGLVRPGGHPKAGGRRAGDSCACPLAAGSKGGGAGVGGERPGIPGSRDGGMGNWGPEKPGSACPAA